MRFEELEKRHYPLLARHYAEAYNAPPWNDEWTVERAAEKIDLLMDSRGAFGLVCYADDGNDADDASDADYDDERGGAFAGAVLGRHDIYYNCRQFYVDELFVPPALQGRGIGTMLLAELERRLAAMGVGKVLLITSKGEHTEDFYKKRGFNTYSGMVLMGKRL